MKLATYQDGSRDGQLVVVSRDLATAHHASGVATRLQQVLDDWNFLSPQLEELSQTLNHGRARHAFAFEPRKCMAPLPRAFQRVVGAAFPSHLERLRLGGGEPPDDALLFRGASDPLLGPCDDILLPPEGQGLDFSAEVAVITGDLAAGTSPDAAIDGIRLLVLANDLVVRPFDPTAPMNRPGRVESQWATAFGPVAVTPDELLHAWRGGRVQLDLETTLNGRRFGLCHAGEPMRFHFGDLISQLCRTRPVRAGSIVSSGAVSNPEAAAGHSCIAERRADEAVDGGAPTTAYLQPGDTLRIGMKGPDGLSLFGTIEQQVAAAA